jgi:hypothetical protein
MSPLLHGAARVGYGFRTLGLRRVATELADTLSHRIYTRARPAQAEAGPRVQGPGSCSWLDDGGEWTVTDLTVTCAELAAFMAETKFPRLYYEGSRRVRYALWHRIGFALCGLTAASVVVDMGAAMGIWGRLARRQFGCTVWDADFRYRPGIHGARIGAGAGAIPLPSNSVSHVVSFCAFNCFEGPADTEFLWESFRLLAPGGKLVIVPLCLSDEHVNLFDPSLCTRRTAFDPGARREPWPGWGNPFGRWYSREAFRQRLVVRGPAFQRTIVRVHHDLGLGDLPREGCAALFVKLPESPERVAQL